MGSRDGKRWVGGREVAGSIYNADGESGAGVILSARTPPAQLISPCVTPKCLLPEGLPFCLCLSLGTALPPPPGPSNAGIPIAYTIRRLIYGTNAFVFDWLGTARATSIVPPTSAPLKCGSSPLCCGLLPFASPDLSGPTSRGEVGKCATELWCGRLWVRIPGKAWGGRSGRSPRKPADQRNPPARFPLVENPGVTRPGIEPDLPGWKASSLTAQPPQPHKNSVGAPPVWGAGESGFESRVSDSEQLSDAVHLVKCVRLSGTIFPSMVEDRPVVDRGGHLVLRKINRCKVLLVCIRLDLTLGMSHDLVPRQTCAVPATTPISGAKKVAIKYLPVQRNSSAGNKASNDVHGEGKGDLTGTVMYTRNNIRFRVVHLSTSRGRPSCCKATVIVSGPENMVHWLATLAAGVAEGSMNCWNAGASPGNFVDEGGRGALVVRQLAFHQGEPGSIPGGVAPGSSHVVILPGEAAGRRILREYPVSSTLSFQRCSIPRFTIIGSYDIDVKSLPNFLTFHSLMDEKDDRRLLAERSGSSISSVRRSYWRMRCFSAVACHPVSCSAALVAYLPGLPTTLRIVPSQRFCPYLPFNKVPVYLRLIFAIEP
ncbi:hypothetical protein PR048_019584 [Dryococelus australis]|uniref:Uncharacterized protein n=1 Tax=Dryococelus australis TaxID=614101 RepID=A0ABQ9H480_9NEOP|nr:hypothetical protein PR048_019584 [Dryococelus australis]